ncbi:flagellar hook-length control protein FliK [Undibacterium sp. Di26W]|uniref:flagellar hook-length control protein FliK n=1 Tax=Undibacterium sp. Di26W TaxID=3413035 RepID=UPI003BEFB89F
MPARLDILTKPVANIEAPAATAAITETKQDITPRLAQLVTGQLLKGEVLSKLMDGSFTVRVAGITAKMLLPEGSKTGDQIPLRLIGTEPRPTFLLESDTDAHLSGNLPQLLTPTPGKPGLSPTLQNYVAPQPAEAGKATPLPATGNNTNATITEAPSETDASAVVTLSGNKSTPQTGNALLDKALTPALQQLATSKITGAIGNTNAVDTTPDHLSSAPTSLSNTGKLIDQILQTGRQTGTKTSISSEVPILASPAELKDGIRTAAKLQNQISASGLFYESHVAEWAQGKRDITDIRNEPQSQLGTSRAADSLQTGNATPVNKEMGQIIHQQLNVLEQNVVRWQGELFPGQKIDWEIRKESEQARHNQIDSEDSSWQSVVSFDLPNLGKVTATINLQSNSVGLSLRAAQSDTVTALKSHANELASALQMAGSPLMSFVVNQNE